MSIFFDAWHPLCAICIYINKWYSFIHFAVRTYDSSTAPFKASSPHSAIWCFLFQFPVVNTNFNVISKYVDTLFLTTCFDFNYSSSV